MSGNIENRILQGQLSTTSDYDELEHQRAQENGDIPSPSPTTETPAPTISHNGPQTGVKGVLADYHATKIHERQQRNAESARLRAEYANAADRSLLGSASESERTIWRKPDAQSDDDSVFDELLEDEESEFFAQYRRKRMEELNTIKQKTTGSGFLKQVSPDEYTQIVESLKDTSTSVCILLSNASSNRESKFEAALRSACRGFPASVFLGVSAELCGFSDPDVLPVLLVYCQAELRHNLVRVTDHLAHPLDPSTEDVSDLLNRVLK